MAPRRLIAAIALALFPALAWIASLHAQPQPAPNSRRRFEVASVKPADTGEPRAQNMMLTWSPGGRFEALRVTLVDVIVRVYPTRRIQLRGGPSWIDTDRFDIIAKADPAGGEPTADERKQMVQALLEERFHLAFHREEREAPVLALMAGKSPPKLDPVKAGEEPLVRQGDRGEVIFQNVGMFGLVNTLSNLWETPVVDRTGIAGQYDFTIDAYQYALQSSGDAAAPRETLADLMRVAIERFGFKLESQRAPLEFTIIDRAEKPGAN
jgi:uncharacterized protein (TIGR03435 family)